MGIPNPPAAVIFPHGRMQNMTISQRVHAIDKILAPVFGCMHCHTGSTATFNITFPLLLLDGTRAPEISLLFPSGHPFEKRERLTWYVATQDRKTKAWSVDDTKPLRSYLAEPDEIKFGYPKPDPLADGGDEDVEFNPADFAASSAPPPAVAASSPVAEPSQAPAVQPAVAEPTAATGPVSSSPLPPLSTPASS